MKTMSDNKTIPTANSELKTTGVLVENGVRITEKSSIDALSQRGYGTAENDVFTLAFHEALYLLGKELLEVKDEKGKEVGFQSLLQCYEKANENAGSFRYSLHSWRKRLDSSDSLTNLHLYKLLLSYA